MLAVTILLPQNVVASTEFEISNGILLRYNGTKGNVVIPDNVTAIANEAFSFNSFISVVTIPASVKSIGEFAFSDCLYLDTVNMKAGVEIINAGAFKNCYRLKSISFPDSVKTIGNNAFENCVSLTSVTFGTGTVKIGTSAFINCVGLTTISIPQNLTTIGVNAFAGCVGLQNFETVSDSVGFVAYDGVLYSKSGSILVAYPQARTGAYSLRQGTVTIAGGAFSCASNLTGIANTSSVEKVESFAFYGCTSLRDMFLPNVKSVGSYAFYACKSLRTIRLGGADIAEHAFSKCETLTTAIIGEGSTALNERAFSDCAKLTRIVLPSSLSFIGSNIFAGSPNVKIMTEIGSTPYKFFKNIAGLSCVSVSVPSSWAVEELKKANNFAITEMQIDYQANTTRAEFCHAVVNFVEMYYGKAIDEVLTERELTVGSFKDTSDADILAANALGIVNGFAGYFDPNAYLTREQAAMFMYNIVINMLNSSAKDDTASENIESDGILNTAEEYTDISDLSPEYTNTNTNTNNISDTEIDYIDETIISNWVTEYKDASSISDWAIKAVYTVSDANIMYGSDGSFNPKGHYTHEQSILTLLRLWNAVQDTDITSTLQR